MQLNDNQVKCLLSWDLPNILGGVPTGSMLYFMGNTPTDNPSFASLLRGGGKTSLGMDLWHRELTGESLWAEPDWLEGEWICDYTLMKSKSKQSRYVRVWKNN